MRIKWVVSGVLVFVTGVVCIGQYVDAFSVEKRPEVQTYRWNVNANGFEGVLEYSVVNNRVSGTFSYWHANRPESDSIEGYQVGRNIVFYRDSTANQLWTGWITESSFGGDNISIAGTFSHLGENSYPWHGLLDEEGCGCDDTNTGGR